MANVNDVAAYILKKQGGMSTWMRFIRSSFGRRGFRGELP